MATINRDDELFLDTSFAVALASSADRFHESAVRLSYQIEALQCRMTTTRAVLLEIGNSLARTRHRSAAIELLESLHGDDLLTILPLSDPLYDDAFELFRARPDKQWGLVDCVSFVVMHE